MLQVHTVQCVSISAESNGTIMSTLAVHSMLGRVRLPISMSQLSNRNMDTCTMLYPPKDAISCNFHLWPNRLPHDAVLPAIEDPGDLCLQNRCKPVCCRCIRYPAGSGDLIGAGFWLVGRASKRKLLRCSAVWGGSNKPLPVSLGLLLGGIQGYLAILVNLTWVWGLDNL